MNLSQLKEKYPNFCEYRDKWSEDSDELVLFTEWDFSSKDTMCFCWSHETDKLYFSGRFEGGQGSGCIGPDDKLPEWAVEFVRLISGKIAEE